MKLKRNAIMKLIKEGKLEAYRTGGDTGDYRITQEQIDRCIQGEAK
jgi:excisionase family DNA binding protein